jgi:hypothetical protein
VISGTAPNISLSIKDIFRRISKTHTGEFRFKNDDLHCFELLWFMDRYPMAIETFDLSRLKAGKKRYFEKEEIVETLFTPKFKAQHYAGLAEGCKLWEYQSQAVEMFRVVKRMLLGDDIGLGKTNTAIGCMLQPGMLPAAVVVPAHLPEQWEERIEDFSNLRVHIIEKTKPYELPEADVYIFSYTKLSGWSDVAATGFFKTIVLDEPQDLRSGTSTEKGVAAKIFCDNATAVLGLTATPVMNYGVEMWHVMQFICPGVLGTLDEFLREWCSNDKIVSDPDALGAYLRQNHNMLRRTEVDVDRELPRPNVTKHYCEYDEAKAKESEDLAYTLAIKATTGSFTERGKAYLELDALTRLQTGVAKAVSVAEYVKILLDADLPVLLSGWHREVYNIWLTELREYNPVMYTGSETKARKRKSKEAFVKGDTNLMIISNRSGAGLDGLQFRCRDLVIGELDWSPMVLKQLIGRLRRSGQSETTNAHYLIASGGSDPLMVEVLGVKSSQAHGIMNPGVAPIAPVHDQDRMKKLAAMVIERRKLAAEAA